LPHITTLLTRIKEVGVIATLSQLHQNVQERDPLVVFVLSVEDFEIGR
jgi:hypothetical protein